MANDKMLMNYREYTGMQFDQTSMIKQKDTFILDIFPECKWGNSIIEWKALRKIAVTVKTSFTMYQFWNYFKCFFISLKI